MGYKGLLKIIRVLNLKKAFILTAFLFVISSFSHANIELDVKIFTGHQITSISFMPIIGKYVLLENDVKISEILKNEIIKFSIENNKINVIKNNVSLGFYSSIKLTGSGYLNAFKIKPIVPESVERVYDDDVKLSIVNNSLLVINHVDIEHYVAGVVQSEGGGSSKDNEFFLVQAIACRTYALNNMRKHFKEGYNLCDSIHCQLYLGRCKNSDILAAVYRTMGDVIVDKDGKMIAAAFHANSGGQTINSEDVWKIPTSYLKSVVDTFSLSMPYAQWEKKLQKKQWLDYLSKKYKYPINNPEKVKKATNFTQNERQVFFTDSTIRLSLIRNDLGLKSTFFSVIDQGDTVLFKGKGYGHGVGISQQGAIRMAQLGYTFKDIIQFYYKDVEILNYEQLNEK